MQCYARAICDWLDFTPRDVGVHITPVHLGNGLIFRTARFDRAPVDLWTSLAGKSITYHSVPGKNSGDMMQGENAKTLATVLSTRLEQARRS